MRIRKASRCISPARIVAQSRRPPVHSCTSRSTNFIQSPSRMTPTASTPLPHSLPIRKRPRVDDLADEESSSSSFSSAASHTESRSPPPDYAVDADDEAPHHHTQQPPTSSPAPKRPSRLAKPRSFLDAVNKHVEPTCKRARKFSQLSIAQIAAGEPYRSTSHSSTSETPSVQCVSPRVTSLDDEEHRPPSRAYTTPSRSSSPPHTPSQPRSLHLSPSSRERSPLVSVSPPRRPGRRASHRGFRRVTPPSPPQLTLARVVSRPSPSHANNQRVTRRSLVAPPRKMRRVETGTQTAVPFARTNVNHYQTLRPRSAHVEVINLCDEPDERVHDSTRGRVQHAEEVVDLCSESEDERIREAARVLTARHGRIATKRALHRR